MAEKKMSRIFGIELVAIALLILLGSVFYYNYVSESAVQLAPGESLIEKFDFISILAGIALIFAIGFLVYFGIKWIKQRKKPIK